jgi:hypothetical protein
MRPEHDRTTAPQARCGHNFTLEVRRDHPDLRTVRDAIMTTTPLTLFLYRDGYSISKSRLRAPRDYREVDLVDPGNEIVTW